MADMCYDAQTSGGLLIAIKKDDAYTFLKNLHDSGIAQAAIIGRILDKGTGRVFIETNGTRNMPEPVVDTKAPPEPQPAQAAAADDSHTCCAESSAESAAAGI